MQPPWLYPPVPAASPPAPPPPGRVMLLPLLSRPRSQAHVLRPARTQLPSGARQKPSPNPHQKSLASPQLGANLWGSLCQPPERGEGVTFARGDGGRAGGGWRRRPLLGPPERDTWMWDRSQGGAGCQSGGGGTRRRVGEAELRFSRSLRYWDGVCSASGAPSVPCSLGRAVPAEPCAGPLAVG